MATLRELLEKRKRLEAQIQKVRSREAAQKRKEESRRKVLIGAAMLEEVAAGSFSEEDLKKILDARLVHPSDRTLFNLPVKPEQPEKVRQVQP